MCSQSDSDSDFDAIVACIAICKKVQVDMNTRATHVLPQKLEEANTKLEILYAQIGGEAFGILALFFSICYMFCKGKTHNMLASMLNSRFKELTCISKQIGRDKAKILVQEYDREVLLPKLVKVGKYSNPHVAQVPPTQAAHTIKSPLDAHFTSEKAT